MRVIRMMSTMDKIVAAVFGLMAIPFILTTVVAWKAGNLMDMAILGLTAALLVYAMHRIHFIANEQDLRRTQQQREEWGQDDYENYVEQEQPNYDG